MKYLKTLVLVIITVLTFGSAMAQTPQQQHNERQHIRHVRRHIRRQRRINQRRRRVRHHIHRQRHFLHQRQVRRARREHRS